MVMENNYVLKLWRKVKSWPFGSRLMAMAIERQAPYFKTVAVKVLDIVPNRAEVLITKKRKVENHIGTVHVIAICNGLEFAMGTMAEASIPKHLRWIPKGMSLDYVAKADSDIRCVAKVNPDDWQPGDLYVEVIGYTASNIEAVRGTIKLWISEKPAKAA
ncbi:hotdog fold domain-containing protein [Ferrimonas senticii]|uniref:hotdog fold domain-containing protein n=1 Tax=Ferrimonas senticii TaxID=394566 RepID=UPI00041C9954|nr:hotdog fold domain-containing protein [Ferrimonas senticii]